MFVWDLVEIDGSPFTTRVVLVTNRNMRVLGYAKTWKSPKERTSLMKQVFTTAVIAFGGSVMGVVFVLSLSAWAENTELDAGPRMIPYNGYLEFDGEAFGGQADISFTLTDDAGCSFVENHEDVQVFAGRFTVNLGTVDNAGNPIAPCLFDADAVYLQMSVRDGGSAEPHIALSGRQRINPVPFAYWAAEGSDFKIDGSATVSGHLSAASADVTGHLDATTANLGASDVRPPSGQPRLELANNVDPDGVDDLNDYQLLTWKGSGAASSFGQGIQGSTMFFNVPLNNAYKFYHNGIADLLTLSAAGSTLTSPFTTSGLLTANAGLNVTGNTTLGTTTLGTTTFNTTDIRVGNNPGRGNGGRAIVHDTSDTLAINYAGDFSGGTSIGSSTHVNGVLNATGGVQSNGEGLFNIPCNTFGVGAYAGALGRGNVGRIDFYCENGRITRIDFRP